MCSLFYLVTILTIPFNFVLSTTVAAKNAPSCQACHELDGGKINVHLVPHSHDDVGWLKTFSQYYVGTGNFHEYGNAGVQYIIGSTIEALKDNPDRRFIQVETAFFYKWWLRQTNETRQDVVDLVNNGQLEIINGGWSMNDEAGSHYQSIIDQFTWGFRVIDRTVGRCGTPKIGWQIDPFGHSREHASLLKQFGFDGLVVGRIDFRDKKRRIQDKSLDFSWKTSSNLDDSELFTSMFPDFYVDEPGFHFDVMYGDYVDSKNLQAKVNKFASILDTYKDYYRTSNIMMPMGNDFTYQKAEVNYESMDRLIKGFADHEKYNVFYSTPSCYIQAVRDEIKSKSVDLEQKSDDFFPYASNDNAFWTGYFTSRPTAKRLERTGNNVLQSAKQLTAFSRINGKEYDPQILSLRQAMGVVQHHDAITGTAKQAVADDYDRMLYEGIKQAEEAASDIIVDLLKIDGGPADLNLTFSTCLLANISICSTSQKDSFVVAAYNPLGRTVTHYIRLPVDGDSYKVTGPDGEEVYDVFDTIHSFDYVTTSETVSKRELVFSARNLPPLGVKLYYVQKATSEGGYKPYQNVTSEDTFFGTETNGFTVDTTTGELKSITLQGLTQEVAQEFLYYPTTSSGAYLFRPATNQASPLKGEKFLNTKFAKGNLVDEYLQVFSDEATQIIRVYKGDDDAYIEFDWLVGDLQYTNNNQGKEIITRFTFKDFSNEGTFYTDSNSREQIKRTLNSRADYNYTATDQPVASNYYPVTSKIVIRDEEKKLEVAVLNDRAQGGSSLSNGSIELMVHRRLTRDDGLGVGEVLNERQFGKGLYARGQHYLTFGSVESSNKNGMSAAAFERQLAQKKLLAPWILVADAVSANISLESLQDSLTLKFEGLSGTLPSNVHLLTLEPWVDSYILRLEHFLEKNEDEKLSESVTVDLNNFFKTFNVTEIKETTLGANEDLPNSSVGDLKISLSPMQIRTFIMKTDQNNSGGLDDGDDNDDDNVNPNSNGSSATESIWPLTLIFYSLLCLLNH